MLSMKLKVITTCSSFLPDGVSFTKKKKIPLITVSVLPSQPGPLVVPHSSAALLRSRRRRHTGRTHGSQIHPSTKGGYLSKLLPLHVFQRQSSTPRGKYILRIDLIIYVPDLRKLNNNAYKSRSTKTPFPVPDH